MSTLTYNIGVIHTYIVYLVQMESKITIQKMIVKTSPKWSALKFKIDFKETRTVECKYLCNSWMLLSLRLSGSNLLNKPRNKRDFNSWKGHIQISKSQRVLPKFPLLKNSGLP